MPTTYRDTQEWSALCFAADRGRGDAARILLEAGADPDAPTKGPFAYDICRGGWDTKRRQCRVTHHLDRDLGWFN